MRKKEKVLIKILIRKRKIENLSPKNFQIFSKNETTKDYIRSLQTNVRIEMGDKFLEKLRKESSFFLSWLIFQVHIYWKMF